MNHPEEAPKLSKFPFIVADLVLIAAAVAIATRSATPITTGPLLAITICVVAGSALLVVPFLANYARRQDAELTERQNQIAALARITSDSAEQLGIVASGLNGIAEASKHNLTAIEKLPAKLQERIDGLTQQFAGSALSAHSSVKEDVARLEAAAEKLARTLAKLESAAKTKTDSLASAEEAFTASLARAAAQIEALVASAATAAEKISSLQPAISAPAAASVVPPAPVTPDAPTAPAIEAETPVAVAPPPPAVPEPVPEPAPAPAPVANDEPAVIAKAEEPAPVPAPAPEPEEPVAEAAPLAPAAEPANDEVPVDEPPAPKTARARKPKPVDNGFDLGLTPDVADEPETAVTSDGFTRLIATAYIGIGNKLFIRGDGPGLSWDKGVPLQFVSIGKWRWETPDATAPVSAKLYKNDQVECSGLGTLTLEPGRQHEVNAGF